MAKDEIIQIRTDKKTKERLMRGALLQGGPQASLGGFLVEIGLERAAKLEELNTRLGRINGVEDPLASIDLLDKIIEEAMKNDVDAIHLSAEGGNMNSVAIRYSKYGEIKKHTTIDVVSYLKTYLSLLGRAGMEENTSIKDGQICHDGKKLRFHIFHAGGRPVISILLKEENKIEAANIYPRIIEEARIASGILIVGPCAGGKTSAMRSIAESMLNENVNAYSVETLREIFVDGINRVEAGGNEAEVIRMLARQNPDLVLVGEIREQSTLKATLSLMHSANKVLTTMHAMDAKSAFARIEELCPGVDSSWFDLIVGSYSYPKLCKHCFKTRKRNKGEELSGFIDKIAIRGNGCGECNKTGYSGREFMRTLTKVKHLANRKMSFEEIITLDEMKKKAIWEGRIDPDSF